jgi:hypothetical protein
MGVGWWITEPGYLELAGGDEALAHAENRPRVEGQFGISLSRLYTSNKGVTVETTDMEW